MPPSRHGRRWPRALVRRLLTIATLVVAIILGVPGLASAHHAEVSAEVACGGLVSFTVFSWPGVKDNPATVQDENEQSRTNAVIAMSYSTDGGSTFRQLPQKPSYGFARGHGYSFSDSFRLPAPQPSRLILRARPAARWGNGTAPSGMTSTPPLVVPACPVAKVTPAGSSGRAAAPGEHGVPGGIATLISGGLLAMALLAAGGWAARRVTRF